MNIYNSEHYPDPTAAKALGNIIREEREGQYRPLVYICSQYSGDVELNIKNARRHCAFAIKQNIIPIAPHLLFPQFLDDNDPEERRLGLRFAMILLDRCEALWIFGDVVSKGMAAEIRRAGRKGMSIKQYNLKYEEVQKNEVS